MMSDEEELDGDFIRHPPAYRSEVFNNFILKLDSRCNKVHSSQPRKKKDPGISSFKTNSTRGKELVA